METMLVISSSASPPSPIRSAYWQSVFSQCTLQYGMSFIRIIQDNALDNSGSQYIQFLLSLTLLHCIIFCADKKKASYCKTGVKYKELLGSCP